MAGQSIKISARQKELQKELRKFTKVMGVMALNHFRGSFIKQGFTDRHLTKWKKRKRGDSSRAILVKTGKLKRSIRIVRKTLTSVTIGSDVPYAIFHNQGASGTSSIASHASRGKGITTSIRGSGGFVGGRFTRGRARRVTFLGAEHQVSAHTRKANLPKREFIGDSKQLERKIITELDTKIRKVFSELRR